MRAERFIPFPGKFFGRQFCSLRVGWTELCQIWGGHGKFIVGPKIRMVFRYVVPFRNPSASNATSRSKIDAKFCTFHTCKSNIRGGVGELSESRFQVQPRSKHLIYFWRGAVVWTASFNTFFPPLFRGRQICSPLISDSGGPKCTKFEDDVGTPQALHPFI